MLTGVTINSDRYVEPLQKFEARVWRLRPDKQRVFFQNYNTSAWTTANDLTPWSNHNTAQTWLHLTSVSSRNWSNI
jgi:hypothetical protein